MLRIGIDARFYGPFGKGLGRYTQRLIEALAEMDKNNEYFIFLRKENFNSVKIRNKNFKKVLADYQWYSLKEQIMMPIVLNRFKLDIVHFPHFNVPIFYLKPFVVTIHDLIITHFPTKKATTLGPILYRVKQLGYKLVIKRAVRRSKKIITVSNYSKHELVDYFKVNEDKITVTHEGTIEKKAVPGKCENLNDKFNIKSPYLLYVGNAYPHKNIEKLLLAFKRIKRDNSFGNLSLVLVGKIDYFYRSLQQQAKSLGLVDVFFTGFVDDLDLATLYHCASLYVFPSFYEGFGLPPLEAMSYDLPVVSSNTTSMPEILEDAAEYFNPNHVVSIEMTIKKVLKDNKKRDYLISKGKEQILKYSWKECAKKTVKIYLEACLSKKRK